MHVNNFITIFFIIIVLLSIAALVSLAVGIHEDYSSRHPEGEPRIGWVDGNLIIKYIIFNRETILIINLSMNRYCHHCRCCCSGINECY